MSALPGYLTGARPEWDVPMPAGVERRPMGWYLERARRRWRERERETTVLDAAQRVIDQAGRAEGG